MTKKRKVTLMLPETSLKLLEDNGVTERKRGEKIAELIDKEYAKCPLPTVRMLNN